MKNFLGTVLLIVSIIIILAAVSAQKTQACVWVCDDPMDDTTCHCME